MSVAERSYLGDYPIAAEAGIVERAEFIKKTYVHLGGAIGAFVALEAVLINLPGVGAIAEKMFTGYNWLFVLGGFMLVSYVADRWAQSSVSPGMQYLGLGLYVVAEAVIFVPLLYFASEQSPQVIPTAATMTVLLFGALTAIVFTTRKDFSFLGPALWLGGVVAIGYMVCGMIFGFSLGTVFTVLMIALAAGYVLYYTSKVLHNYRIDQHVAASLALFASIALLFWYILRLVMSRE